MKSLENLLKILNCNDIVLMDMDILIRLGELTLKSRRSRRRFMNRLIDNIRDALTSNGYKEYEIVNMWSRILVKVDGDDKIFNVLRRVFGIVGFMEVVTRDFDDLNDIVSMGVEIYRDIIRNKVFAVKAKREGKHSFRSIDVNRELGKALTPYAKGVDLKNPDIWVKLEIRGNKVFYYLREFKAYGGLPIGTDGRIISLVSGGFDSAVASWYALKRGAEVHYFHAQLASEEYLKKVLRVVSVLAKNWSYGYRPKMYVADYRPLAAMIRDRIRRDYRIVILKRFMYRGGEYIADLLKADSLVTGEVLGQVSSQTLRNLKVSQEAIKIPVNRPLFGLDKDDIMKIAMEIGTYESSKEVEEVCALVERFPVLRASSKVVEEEESKLDFRVFEESLDNIRVYDLRDLEYDLKPIEDYPIEYDEIPDNAVLIDVRPSNEYIESHIPGSINIPQEELSEYIEDYRDRPIIIICRAGVLSKYIAYILRRKGYKAYYLVGGFERFRRRY